ncbi:MAG TPA: segregation/condensation protein A [Mollicutes bacterium]|jgi:segregation and condensation protein A|nr:segregation/condensation protein A [Mollicutes bacterium]
MEYKVKIDEFEGPLDLLLHLIKESNIDIWEIKISEITEQYLGYIRAMEELNLSIASEYLVMAAELIEIKSRSLLPTYSDENEDEYEEDPRENLIRRLIEYKHYKEITSTFKDLEQERSEIYTKVPSNIDEYKEKTTYTSTQPISILLDAYNKMLERMEYQKPLNTKIASKELSVGERIIKIRNVLSTKEEVKFEELFDEWNRSYVVVTFLAILQMTKDQEVLIKQDSKLDNIYIKLKGSA